MNPVRLRVAIICGTQELSLHPVPPIADSAPEWNVFRLAQALIKHPILEVRVVSPCEHTQTPELRASAVGAEYHNIEFGSVTLAVYRTLLRRLLPIRLFVRLLAKLPDLLSWLYLRRVLPWLRATNPDFVFINGRPQYVRYLRRNVKGARLLLFVRAPMGESARHLQQLDGIVVNSQGMADYVRSLVKDVPCWIVPNSLGDEFATPESAPGRFAGGRKRVLFAGRLVPEKGVSELIAAFRLVKEAIPDSELWIYGAADNFRIRGAQSEYERSLRRLASSLPAGSVEFAGYVPQKLMGAEYSRADVAVFPSIWLESFGMVALEAMRCRTPVVASRRPGFEEVIVPGETGLLVDDPTDTHALARAVIRVLQDPQQARRMGEAGYVRSLSFTPDVAAGRFAEIVETLCASNRTKDIAPNG